MNINNTTTNKKQTNKKTNNQKVRETKTKPKVKERKRTVNIYMRYKRIQRKNSKLLYPKNELSKSE